MKKTLIRSLCDQISVFLFLLDLAFDLKIQLFESIHSLFFGLPQTSPRCLKERLSDAAKRPWIHTLHPVLHLGIQGIGGGEASYIQSSMTSLVASHWKLTATRFERSAAPL